VAQVAVPIIASAVGAGISSRGSKKAAKNAKPSVPGEFKGPVGQASGLLGNRLAGGFPPFAMPGSGGDVLSMLQNTAIGQAGNTLGAGNQGFQDALRTMQSVASLGIDPAAVRGIQDQLDPFFSYQRNQGLAQTREASAAGGRFFGTGALQNESNFMNQFLANQAGTILPLALQNQQLKMQGAQGSMAAILGQQNYNQNAFNLGEQERQARLNEFLRTQPENAIPYLASLMQGTPLSYNPQGTNFGQNFGGSINSMLGSPGFWQYMQNAYVGNQKGPG